MWFVVVVAVEEHVEWQEKGASMALVWMKREKLWRVRVVLAAVVTGRTSEWGREQQSGWYYWVAQKVWAVVVVGGQGWYDYLYLVSA